MGNSLKTFFVSGATCGNCNAGEQLRALFSVLSIWIDFAFLKKN